MEKNRDSYCCVLLCNGNARICIDLSFHHIPSVKKMELRTKWIVAIRRDEGRILRFQDMTRQIVFLVLVLALFIHIAQSNPDKNAGYLLHVCKEDSIKLFAGTSINPTEELSVTIYHNETAVGLWTNNESKCYKKICRDGKSDIWLNGFNESDNGPYTLLYQRQLHGPIEKEKEKTFQVTIPPLPSCKPHFDYVPVDRVSGNLTAFLPEIGCGIPPVTLYWFSGPNQKYNKEDFASLSQCLLIHLRVNSLENPGMYIACIGGPALRCVKDQSYTDFCYEFHVPEFKSDGTHVSAVQSIDRTNGTQSSEAIIILTFIAVTMQCFVYLTLNLERIRKMIQNKWRYWRHGNAINVGDIGRPKDPMDNQSSESSSIIT